VLILHKRPSGCKLKMAISNNNSPDKNINQIFSPNVTVEWADNVISRPAQSNSGYIKAGLSPLKPQVRHSLLILYKSAVNNTACCISTPRELKLSAGDCAPDFVKRHWFTVD
jgi:hypothetical protein